MDEAEGGGKELMRAAKLDICCWVLFVQPTEPEGLCSCGQQWQGAGAGWRSTEITIYHKGRPYAQRRTLLEWRCPSGRCCKQYDGRADGLFVATRRVVFDARVFYNYVDILDEMGQSAITWGQHKLGYGCCPVVHVTSDIGRILGA